MNEFTVNTHFDRNRHEKATESGEIQILNLQNWYHDWYHQLVLVPTSCVTLSTTVIEASIRFKI